MFNVCGLFEESLRIYKDLNFISVDSKAMHFCYFQLQFEYFSLCTKNDGVAYTNHMKQVDALSMTILKRWMQCLADFHQAVCCVSALQQVN